MLDSHTEEATIHANLGIAISHLATSFSSIHHLDIKIKVNNWYHQAHQTYHTHTYLSFICKTPGTWQPPPWSACSIEKSPQSILEDSFQYSDVCMGVWCGVIHKCRWLSYAVYLDYLSRPRDGLLLHPYMTNLVASNPNEIQLVDSE